MVLKGALPPNPHLLSSQKKVGKDWLLFSVPEKSNKRDLNFVYLSASPLGFVLKVYDEHLPTKSEFHIVII